MFMRGEITPQIDAAIFADTQEEPRAVYEHLAWLQSLNGPPILTGTKGKLGDDLANGTGERAASIPAFTKGDGANGHGQILRQCSKEYKTQVIGQVLRRQGLGLEPGRRVAKGTVIYQYFGISADEAGRAKRIRERVESSTYRVRFPLLELFMTRADCVRYLADKVPHETPRSACVFCPYHSDQEWHRIKTTDPSGWARAVELDRAMRLPGWAGNRQMERAMYLHRSCQPLELVQLDTRPKAKDLQLAMSFWAECEGVCGV